MAMVNYTTAITRNHEDWLWVDFRLAALAKPRARPIVTRRC